MKSDLINREELTRFLDLIYRKIVFNGSITLTEAMESAKEEIGTSRFEALALYYRAKQDWLLYPEISFNDSSFKIQLSLTGKGMKEVKLW